MIFGPFLGTFFKKKTCGPLLLLENGGNLVGIIKKIYSSFQVLNATCDAVTHAQPNQNPEKTRFPTAPVWESGTKNLGVPPKSKTKIKNGLFMVCTSMYRYYLGF